MYLKLKSRKNKYVPRIYEYLIKSTSISVSIFRDKKIFTRGDLSVAFKQFR